MSNDAAPTGAEITQPKAKQKRSASALRAPRAQSAPTHEVVTDATVDSGPLSMRRRAMAKFASSGRSAPPELDQLLRTLRSYHPKADRQLVIRAYERAAAAHRDQRRLSGQPYLVHPVAVAEILAELGMTAATVAAGLLHDTVEDTDYSLSQLSEDFGEEIARLVDGVTKLDRVKYGEVTAAETVRKMVVAMARDIRVLVIKLADRLHNMRTLGYMAPQKRESKARETLEIYAPLAHRLGMNNIKWELEDLAFATLYPMMYEEIVRLVGQHAPSRDLYLANVIDIVQGDLRNAKIKAEVTGRPKHYYSIYQKMIVRGRDFASIYDLVGVRILVESERDCYAVLGMVHARWKPVAGRFKDYIAMPKATYQSLHTTVIGPEGRTVELQIRTYDMDRAADFGVAAHWRYKQLDVAGKHGPDDMGWLRQLLDWQRETEDPDEFLDTLRYDLAGAEVYVFTPKGDVIALPVGSTPIDFAYAVHTEVGHRCIGARVNGDLVSLESELDNGDVVEIFLSRADHAGPSRDWLTYVKSPRARNKIKSWFSRERRDEAIEVGKDQLAREMRKQGLPIQRLLHTADLLAIVQELQYGDISALYAAIGEKRLSASAVVSRLIDGLGGQEGADDDIAEETLPDGVRQLPSANPGVAVKGLDDVWVKLARCCTPVPGDEIVGFVTRTSGVSVHRASCPNVPDSSTESRRMVEVEWVPTSTGVFLVNIQVEALDRARLLSDVTRALSDQHVNILAASVATTRDRIAFSRFTFEMADPKHLGALLKTVKGVEGVYDVYRV